MIAERTAELEDQGLFVLIILFLVTEIELSAGLHY